MGVALGEWYGIPDITPQLMALDYSDLTMSLNF